MKRNLIPILTFLICFSGIVSGQIIHIPDDYPSIQEGIDAAVEGDTVLVAEGIYNENLVITGKAITLASHYLIDEDTSHISKTIIDGSEASDSLRASVVIIEGVPNSRATLTGFTITGGSGTYNNLWNTTGGGGIYIISISSEEFRSIKKVMKL